jgi:hypothetical protein
MRDDFAEAPNDSTFLGPNLRHAGEQIEDDQDQRQIAEALHEDGVCLAARRG